MEETISQKKKEEMPEEEKVGTFGKIKRPTSCSLVVINGCPLRCKMCHMWKAPSMDNEVKIDELIPFVDKVKEVLIGEKELVISGGEPLMKKGVLDLVSHASRSGLKTIMPTNGCLIDEKMAKKIADSGLSEIFISLDSFNPKTHDFLRGVEGAYDKVMKAIEYLSKYSTDTKINILTVLSGVNITEVIEHMHRIHNDPRLAGVYFQAVQEPFWSQAGPEWYEKEEFKFLWPKDSDYVEKVLDELNYLKHEKSMMVHNHSEQLEIFKAYFKNPRKRARKGPCYIGDYVINVNPQGDIFLCCLSIPIGNIRRDDIRNLWFSGSVHIFRQLMHNCTLYCHNMVNCFFKEDNEIG